MSGLSSDVSGVEPYNPPGSAPIATAQVTDVSACLITLPLTLLVSPADVEIYGKAMASAAPLVDCSGMLDLQVLVGATPAESAINFKQDDADANSVTVTVPATFNDTSGGKFAVGFDSVLNKPVQLKSLDTNTYIWWNEEGKSIATDPNFSNPKSVLYQHADFSQFVLAKIAYDVFGHPLAQAGIANDKTITGELKGTSGTAGSLGTRLAAAFKQLSAAQLQSIYEQMLAQDPSRFNLEDASGGALGSNGASQVGMPRTLPFSGKDIIRFEIVIDDYDVKRVALNATGGNDVTTKSNATITSGITAASANNGSVLSTRYAGLRTTVQVKLKAGFTVQYYLELVEALKASARKKASDNSIANGGSVDEAATAAAAAEGDTQAVFTNARQNALTAGDSELEAARKGWVEADAYVTAMA